MTALATFLATAKRIEAILEKRGDLAMARLMPEIAARRVDEVSITASQPYYNRSPEPETVAASKVLRERLKDELVAAAEAARDARLAEIAAELTALRAVLPQQAAAVAIELGHQARMLQHEAEGWTA